MALPRLLATWALVFLLLGGWEEARRRLVSGPEPPRTIRHSLLAPAGESLLLVLFAALWFASLGSGGWVLLFAITGGLVEIPLRLRAPSGFPWIEVLSGIVRVVLAGAICQALLI
jgi:hypothetical protein